MTATDQRLQLADEAADALATMHRDGHMDLHAHTPLAEFVTAWFGPYERDGMDEADDQQAAWKDES